MTDARIRVVVLDPERDPVVRGIDATLAGLQACVGGPIELLRCGKLWPVHGVILYVHGEGLLLDLHRNVVLSGQGIHGPIVVTAEDADGEMRPLTPVEIVGAKHVECAHSGDHELRATSVAAVRPPARE